MPKNDRDGIQRQREEFDALDELTQAYKRLPPIVDDDYPEMRHGYEHAVNSFLKACKENGRKWPA